MHAAIKDTLFPLVVQVTRAVCSNYGLEAIASISDNSGDQELLRLIIKTFKPPPLSDILNQNLDNTVVVHTQFLFPSYTVLFDVLSERLLTLIRMTTCEFGNNDEILRVKFKSAVESSPISHAVAFINSHPKLRISFKHDFIKRNLQLPRMIGGWLDLCVLFLDKLQPGSDVSDLYLSVHLQGNVLSSLGVLLHPLLDLKEPDDLIDIIRKRFSRVDFEPTEIGKISTALLELSVERLWRRLLKLCTGTSAGLVDNWLHVFHQFHMQYPQHNALIGILSEDELLHLDIMTIVFCYITATDQSTLKAATEAIVKASTVDCKIYLGLSHFVPLITSLCDMSRYFTPF